MRAVRAHRRRLHPGRDTAAGRDMRPGRHRRVFAYTAGAWHLAGPALPAALAGQHVRVLRLTRTGSSNTALLEAGTGSAASLLAAWTSDGGRHWRLSPALRLAGIPGIGRRRHRRRADRRPRRGPGRTRSTLAPAPTLAGTAPRTQPAHQRRPWPDRRVFPQEPAPLLPGPAAIIPSNTASRGFSGTTPCASSSRAAGNSAALTQNPRCIRRHIGARRVTACASRLSTRNHRVSRTRHLHVRRIQAVTGHRGMLHPLQ